MIVKADSNYKTAMHFYGGTIKLDNKIVICHNFMF